MILKTSEREREKVGGRRIKRCSCKVKSHSKVFLLLVKERIVVLSFEHFFNMEAKSIIVGMKYMSHLMQERTQHFFFIFILELHLFCLDVKKLDKKPFPKKKKNLPRC